MYVIEQFQFLQSRIWKNMCFEMYNVLENCIRIFQSRVKKNFFCYLSPCKKKPAKWMAESTMSLLGKINLQLVLRHISVCIASPQLFSRLIYKVKIIGSNRTMRLQKSIMSTKKHISKRQNREILQAVSTQKSLFLKFIGIQRFSFRYLLLTVVYRLTKMENIAECVFSDVYFMFIELKAHALDG